MKKFAYAVTTAAVLAVTTVGAQATSLPQDEGGVGAVREFTELPRQLDPVELETTRAGLGPLALVLGLSSLDLALIGVYWGVYVPNYTPTEPAFDTNID